MILGLQGFGYLVDEFKKELGEFSPSSFCVKPSVCVVNGQSDVALEEAGAIHLGRSCRWCGRCVCLFQFRQ